MPIATAAGIIAGAEVDPTFYVGAGKLVNSKMCVEAFAHGVDACYTARGFMFALGCIQVMSCNNNDCPTSISTQDPRRQRGLNIENKSNRVANYAVNLHNGIMQLLAATLEKIII